MIFYFSGTGNSQWAAKRLSLSFNERLISVENKLLNEDLNYFLDEDEKIFFVFPIHSWGPAILIYRLLKKIKFKNYNKQPIYILCVCGDNCGQTDKIVMKILKRHALVLTKAFSLQMPNNYILMKGFGLDAKEVEDEKLSKAPLRLEKIIENIIENKKEQIYERGNVSWIKSYIVYPLFRTFAIKKNAFYAKDNCISCGLCEDICPVNAIKLSNGKPVWNNKCVQCTACIHRCPVQAIEYGKISLNQGRYHHPEVS